MDSFLEDNNEVAVEPCGEVAIGVEDGHVMCRDAVAGDGDEAHERPVSDEETGSDGKERAGSLCREADETGDEVADCNSGEDSEDAEMGVVEVRIEAEEEIESEDGGAAADDVKAECAAGFALADARIQRQDNGGADEEEEVGEDDVGEGEAVPGGVVKLGEGVGPVAGIVDKNHEGDGEAAENVDGEYAGR